MAAACTHLPGMLVTGTFELQDQHPGTFLLEAGACIFTIWVNMIARAGLFSFSMSCSIFSGAAAFKGWDPVWYHLKCLAL